MVCVCVLLFCLSFVHARDIAFFYALDADYKSFASNARPLGDPIKTGSRSIQHLKLGQEDVYAVKMGSGAVETAVSASTLLTKFPCDLAFSVGPVGTLDDALAIGSWHRVGPVIPHQKGSWGKEGFQGELSVGAAKPVQATPARLPGKFLALSESEAGISVASGELFVASSTYRQQLRAATGAQAVDMNLFGLEAVCRDRGLPLYSWRIVSDYADDTANESFKTFVKSYRGEGGAAVAHLINELPPDGNSPDTYPEIKHLLETSKAATP